MKKMVEEFELAKDFNPNMRLSNDPNNSRHTNRLIEHCVSFYILIELGMSNILPLFEELMNTTDSKLINPSLKKLESGVFNIKTAFNSIESKTSRRGLFTSNITNMDFEPDLKKYAVILKGYKDNLLAFYETIKTIQNNKGKNSEHLERLLQENDEALKSCVQEMEDAHSQLKKLMYAVE